MVARRQPFRDWYQQLKRQHRWLLDLEGILDEAYQRHDRGPLLAAEVAARVDEYLCRLLATVELSGDKLDQAVARRIDRVFRHRWWGLFTCYEFDFLPRTNNDLEQLIRNLKAGYRRTTGRKCVQNVIVRYGRYIAFVDPLETFEQLLDRLSRVAYEGFARERRKLEFTLARVR